LPDSIERLELGSKFNQPIQHIHLPASLQVFSFPHAFNQPIEHIKLPPSLHTLCINGEYDHPIEQLELPPSLTDLTWKPQANRHVFQHPVSKLKLPHRLRSLTILQSFPHAALTHLQLPATLRQLTYVITHKRVERATIHAQSASSSASSPSSSASLSGPTHTGDATNNSASVSAESLALRRDGDRSEFPHAYPCGCLCSCLPRLHPFMDGPSTRYWPDSHGHDWVCIVESDPFYAADHDHLAPFINVTRQRMVRHGPGGATHRVVGS